MLIRSPPRPTRYSDMATWRAAALRLCSQTWQNPTGKAPSDHQQTEWVRRRGGGWILKRAEQTALLCARVASPHRLIAPTSARPLVPILMSTCVCVCVCVCVASW